MRKELEILLVDDDRIEFMKLSRATASKNHKVVLAKNGAEAIEQLNTYIPDVILLDLNMPDTNGIEFLTYLKNHEKLKYIPTVVLTTSNNKDDIYQCYTIGIAGYFLKPLRYEDYEIKINSILDYWSLNEFK